MDINGRKFEIIYEHVRIGAVHFIVAIHVLQFVRLLRSGTVPTKLSELIER